MRILSVDGGGYLGLATVAFIEGVERHFRCRFADRFDLFCGTSTGAIIALGLAAGKSGSDLRILYERLGSRVLVSTRWRRTRISRLIRPKYEIEPLRQALTETFGDLTLGDLQRTGKKVLATSFCLTSGQARIFKTDHSSNLTRHSQYRIVDVALASSAAPTYFPLVKLVDLQGAMESFCDGGVVANQPDLMGFAEALGECEAPPHEIRLLSISTPRMDLAQNEPIVAKRGLWQWRDSLADVFIDGSARLSGEVLSRVVRCYPAGQRPVYERVVLQNRYRLQFDNTSASATQALLHEGASQASANSIRQRVAPFFT